MPEYLVQVAAVEVMSPGRRLLPSLVAAPHRITEEFVILPHDRTGSLAAHVSDANGVQSTDPADDRLERIRVEISKNHSLLVTNFAVVVLEPDNIFAQSFKKQAP